MSTLGERLQSARKRKQLTQNQLAKRINVKKGAIISSWEHDLHMPNPIQIKRLCEVLDIGADYLLDYYGGTGPIITPEDEQLIQCYHSIDDDGRKLVRFVAEHEHARCTRAKKHAEYEMPATRYINLYGTAAAGPYGEWFTGEEPEPVLIVLDDISEHAEYAVEVSGDSMEPEYENGDLLLVRQTSAIDPGELGVFAYDGKGFFKKLGEDGTLISLNPKYPPIVPVSGWAVPQGRVIGKAKKVEVE